tara:strand:+ start:42 stop:446 length:405 start_codon:yes stop_codon:yes gene_type:complete
MKPFTSKRCTQYLTKESPLNQGLIRENDNRPREVINAEIKKAIEKREESMSKPKPTVIDKLSKKDTPLNQGLILANQDANDPNVKKAVVRGVRKAEEAGLIKKVPKKPTNNRLAPAGYSKRTKFDNAAKKALKK